MGLPRPPLSVRESLGEGEHYSVLCGGIPAWMHTGVYGWAEGFFEVDEHSWDSAAIQRAAQYLQVPLPGDENMAAMTLLDLLEDDLRGLDLLDYCLGTFPTDRPEYLGAAPWWVDTVVEDLQDILSTSSSAWSVGRDDKGRYCLQRRVNATAERSAFMEMKRRERAAEYLRSAWHHTYSRNPNTNAAYGDAIRAVEAAARPILTPLDPDARLGKMIQAVKDKPEKWITEVGSVETVRQMMHAICYSHSGRHGTEDKAKPANVSQAQAEAAVNLAVALVQIFRTKTIRPVLTTSEL